MMTTTTMMTNPTMRVKMNPTMKAKPMSRAMMVKRMRKQAKEKSKTGTPNEAIIRLLVNQRCEQPKLNQISVFPVSLKST